MRRVPERADVADIGIPWPSVVGGNGRHPDVADRPGKALVNVSAKVKATAVPPMRENAVAGCNILQQVIMCVAENDLQ
jgi:hypothetical protein